MCIPCADAFIGFALISLYMHVIHSIVITDNNNSLCCIMCVIKFNTYYTLTLFDTISKSFTLTDVGLY